MTLLANAFTGNQAKVTVDDNQEMVEVEVNSESEISQELNTELLVNNKPKSTKEIVIEYFSDTPILADIAFCESRYTQLDSDGSIHRGRINPQDVGVMQINEKYHLETSKKMGLDIYSLEGNLAYAKYLYETQGTKPWKYSAKCWNIEREVALNI